MKEKNRSKYNIMALIVIAILMAFTVIIFVDYSMTKEQSQNTTKPKPVNKIKVVEQPILKSSYLINDNGLNDFDLVFMQLENTGKNNVYSPLSIKYALEMLSEGADGNTKTELDSVIGHYVARKYTNSNNMSFANAFFVRDSYQANINSEYITNLQNKYNAELIYDNFNTPDKINNWVSEKTFDLIPELLDDVSENDYVLVNALAIDMEWNKKIQSVNEEYRVALNHEKVTVSNNENTSQNELDWFFISELAMGGYTNMKFNQSIDFNAIGVQMAAVINKYDIIKELGENNIRNIVQEDYERYINSFAEDYIIDDYFDLDEYIVQLKQNYKHISSSTDFSFYDDEQVKVFAKDLKTYNGLTLQYIGIMPKEESLPIYIKNSTAESINKIISNLQTIEYDNFEDGYLTYIHGNIPLFSYEYELSLVDDLKTLGINDVFMADKANLSKMTKTPSYVNDAVHKAKIEFSNEGIKAAAATAIGGKGGVAAGYDYQFEIPVKDINLTFDKPFMYIIRDKSTGEVWFAGSVYEPLGINSSLESVY